MRTTRLTAIGAVIAMCFTGATATAQLPTGSAAGINGALTRLFGATTAFTAQVEVQVLDASRQEMLRMPMGFAGLNGNIRVEIDIGQVKSKELSAQEVKALKQAGINRIVTIIRPDKKASYILYPGTQNYSIVPMPKEEADAIGRSLTVDKAPLGKETVDGHPCVKNRVTVKDSSRVVLEATTWNATDLKEFPVQIETKDKGNTSILRFRQIKFARPDPSRFEPPAEYKLAG